MKKMFILLVMISISSCAKTQQNKFDVSKHLYNKGTEWELYYTRFYKEYIKFSSNVKPKKFYNRLLKNDYYTSGTFTMNKIYGSVFGRAFTIDKSYGSIFGGYGDELKNDIFIIFLDTMKMTNANTILVCFLKENVKINKTLIEEINKVSENLEDTKSCDPLMNLYG